MSYGADKVKEWRKRTKERALAAMGGRCVLCNYDKCTRSLTFHHLDPSQKDFQVNCGHAHAWADIVTELRKCVLLCHNCHGEVHEELTSIPDTAQRFDESYAIYKPNTGGRKKSGIIPHGTRNAYRYHRCRCEACRAANTVYMRKQRAKRVVSLAG